MQAIAHALFLLIATGAAIDAPINNIPRSVHLLLLPLAAATMFIFGGRSRYMSTLFPSLCLLLFALFGSRLLTQAEAFAPPLAVRMANSIINHTLAGFALAGVLLIFRDNMKQKVHQTRELAQAVTRGELVALYQPQVDERGALLGAEALVRWQHPTRGLLSPAHFIALAEDSLLIHDIGQEILRQACALLREWQDDPLLREKTISVNVSQIQLFDKNFTATVRQILQDSGANPARLELELTESALSIDAELAKQTMWELRNEGIRWALDDFGTGFSSLALLRTLPVQKIKIDRQFVLDAQHSESGRGLLVKIVEIANVLGMEAIAEGVESQQKWELLVQLGSKQFQGFFFGRPQPPEALTLMARGHHRQNG